MYQLKKYNFKNEPKYFSLRIYLYYPLHFLGLTKLGFESIKAKTWPHTHQRPHIHRFRFHRKMFLGGKRTQQQQQ